MFDVIDAVLSLTVRPDLIQIFGVRGYGEVEFILSMIKIAACAGFIILGIVINCGGAGNQGYLGAKYWHDPGAFANGFNGFAGVFVVAAFAFGGTELVGLAAAESENPVKSLPDEKLDIGPEGVRGVMKGICKLNLVASL